MWNTLFWKDTAERVIATVAQVLIALFTADGFNLLTLDWQATAATVAVAAVLVVLKAIAANAATGPSVSPASLAHDERGV